MAARPWLLFPCAYRDHGATGDVAAWARGDNPNFFACIPVRIGDPARRDCVGVSGRSVGGDCGDLAFVGAYPAADTPEVAAGNQDGFPGPVDGHAEPEDDPPDDLAIDSELLGGLPDRDGVDGTSLLPALARGVPRGAPSTSLAYCRNGEMSSRSCAAKAKIGTIPKGYLRNKLGEW